MPAVPASQPSQQAGLLCPFRKTFGLKYEDQQLEIDGIGKPDSIRGEIFGYCLQAKCAMWRGAGWSRPADDRPGYVEAGHCGLVGRP